MSWKKETTYVVNGPVQDEEYAKFSEADRRAKQLAIGFPDITVTEVNYENDFELSREVVMIYKTTERPTL